MRQILFVSFLLVAVAALLGCDSDGNSPVSSDSAGDARTPLSSENVAIEIGETASLFGGELTIEFSEKTSDSRCPVGVDCFWEGVAEIKLTTNLPDFAEVVITLFSPNGSQNAFPSSVVFGGYQFQLESVAPYPVYEQPQTQPDVAHLVVTQLDALDQVTSEQFQGTTDRSSLE